MNQRITRPRHGFIFVLLLAAVLAGGCGDAERQSLLFLDKADPDPTGGGGGLPDPSQVASVSGVAMLTGDPLQPVIVVDDPASAPAGATPLTGVEVRILRPFGETVTTATTGADGSFSVTGLDLNHIIVEVRQDPASSSPDATILATLVRGATIELGAPCTTTRQEAVDAVLAIAGSDALICCTQNPLPEGTEVFPGLGDSAGVVPIEDLTRTIPPGGEWFLLVDENPHSQLWHDMDYYFVHCETGEVTTVTREWLPAFNGHEVWAFDEELVVIADVERRMSAGEWDTEMEALFSADLVQIPFAPDISMALPATAAGSVPKAAASSPSCRVIEREDRFALLVGGTLESWVAESLNQMRGWCLGQSIPAENITTIAFSRVFPNPSGWIPSSPIQRIQPLAPTSTTLAQAATIIGGLAAAVQARLDAGGHPVLFAYVASHGDRKGQILVIEGLLEAISALRGNKKSVPVDTAVPVQSIPACQIRLCIDACFSANHILRYATAFSGSSQDVEIYSSSGNNVGQAYMVERLVGSALRDVFVKGEYSRALGRLTHFDQIGSLFARAWVQNVTLSPDTWQLNGIDGGWRVRPGGPTSFSFTTTQQEIQNVLNQSGRPKNDRVCYDNGQEDPCCAPGGGIIVDPGGGGIDPPSPEWIVTPEFISFEHEVGSTPCPQPIGTISIVNTGNVPLRVTTDAGILPLNIVGGQLEIQPGASGQFEVSFDCSQASSFSGDIQLDITAIDPSTGTPLGSSTQETVMVAGGVN